MPRLVKVSKGDLPSLPASTWDKISLCPLVGGGPRIPNVCRLTTLVIQFEDMASGTRNFWWGLTEDTLGNYPLTGLNGPVDMRIVKSVDSSEWGGYAIKLDIDYKRSSFSDKAGYLHVWLKVDGTATVKARAYLSHARSN